MPHVVYPRRALDVTRGSMRSFRAVVLQGARQVGKSTLALEVAHEVGAAVASLDADDDLTTARDDATLFLESLGKPAVIDEIQRAGDRVVLAVKQQVDRDRSRGQYLLTGSTNFLTTPTITESLAGRIDLITLWPLAMGELSGGTDTFVDRAFDGREALLAHRGPMLSRDDYLERLCRGGYPEVQTLGERARQQWFERYSETVLRREVETAADLRRFDALVRMARLMIAGTGSELVISRLADGVGVDRQTAEVYEPWIETTFLVHRVPAWSRKLASKVVRRPKIYVCDTGLAAALLGKSPAALARLNEPATGPLVESFVIDEIAKQLTWNDTSARLHHLRERNGLEIDGVVEALDGRVIAIEVKSSTVAHPADARPMAILRDRLDRVGNDFVAGVVFHTGNRRVPLGDRLVGLPIADLWT